MNQTYPSPVHVNIYSSQQLAEYLKSLSIDQRKEIKELYTEYMKCKELHLCIESIENDTGPEKMLRYLDNLRTFENFIKIYKVPNF